MRTARAAGAEVVVMSIDESQPAREDELAHVVSEAGASFLTLGPLLRAWQQRGMSYRIPNDGHWNPGAHARIAEALREHVCSGNLAEAAGCEKEEE